MFAYCNNAPVNNHDSTGNVPQNVNSPMTDGGNAPTEWKVYAIGKKTRYSASTWNASSLKQKKAILEAYMLEVASKMNVFISPHIKYFYKEPSTTLKQGYYSFIEGTIYINEYYLMNYSRSDIFSTILHELRHCYQQAAVYGYGFYGYENPYSVDEATRKTWAYNIYEYISPQTDFEAYWNQPIEIDARLFAEETRP